VALTKAAMFEKLILFLRGAHCIWRESITARESPPATPTVRESSTCCPPQHSSRGRSWPALGCHKQPLMAPHKTASARFDGTGFPAQFSAYFRPPSECASVRQPRVFVSTLGCSRESCLALLESLPKPNKQQHAAQRHKEWNQLSHRPPPDLQVQHYSGASLNAARSLFLH
jgi:hypothetical protein